MVVAIPQVWGVKSGSLDMRRTGPRGIGLLIVLTCLLQVQMPHAVLNIVWRLAVLSFDNPATQTLDDLACETPFCTDARTTAEASTRLLPRVADRLFEPSPENLQRLARSGCITRSPPLA